MNSTFYKVLILLFGVALSLSMAAWLKTRQEMQAVTVANEVLRKTLGDMTIAIVKKDKEIDRLGGSRCDAGEKSQVSSGSRQK